MAQITGENYLEDDKGEPPHPPLRKEGLGEVTRRALPEQASLVNKVVYNHSQHSLWRSLIRQMSSRTITLRLGERQYRWPPALPPPIVLVREALTPEQEWLRLLAALGRLSLR